MSNSITPFTVREAYYEAKPEWAVPSDADCESLAFYLAQQQRAREDRKARLDHVPNTEGRRRVRQAEDVRSAIGVLLRNLPDLVAFADARPELAASPHAASLNDLLAATQLAAGWWPSLDGTLRKFDPRCAWALWAQGMVGAVLMRWQRANPGRRIGKPLTTTQPATRLLVRLIGLVEGADPSAEAVAQTFTRHKDAFVIFDSNNAERDV